jgi:hypothetical protein
MADMHIESVFRQHSYAYRDQWYVVINIRAEAGIEPHIIRHVVREFLPGIHDVRLGQGWSGRRVVSPGEWSAYGYISKGKG